MLHILRFIILSTAAAASPDYLGEQATEIFSCDFEQSTDANFDLWPDGWTRRRGRGYPLYLPIEIEDAGPPQGRCLKLQLDGGAAAMYSPEIEVSSAFSYVLQARLRTEGLIYDVAYCEIIFYDENGEVLETHRCESYRTASQWVDVNVGPITTRHDNIQWARVGLHLRPTDRADLRGRALFDDVWLGQLPRLSVDTDAKHNVFTDPEQVQLTCRVSGVSQPGTRLRFELFDIEGKSLATTTKPISRRQGDPELPGTKAEQPGAGQQKLRGSASWNPPISENGFYRIRISMGDFPNSANVPLVVAGPEAGMKKKNGEFGWTLPQEDHPIPLRALPDLLTHAGIHWVKFPVWYDGQDKDRGGQLARLAEKLGAQNIKMVGVLDQPPPETRELFGQVGSLPVASVFAEPEVWLSSLEPVLTRLGLKLRWWQLGADDDTSLASLPELEDKLREIRRKLNQFGQEVHLGVPWPLADPSPEIESPPWSFLSYLPEEAAIDEQKIPTYLPSGDRKENRQWVLVQPLSGREHDLETRATDLVLRMLAAKLQNAHAIFARDPFDADHGLMEPDGSPAELFLVWRTTARMLSGTEYLGSINLPEGSRNHIFLQDDQAVMVVWNDQPVRETIYLGEDIRHVDLWGRRQTPELVRDGISVRQQIEVGPRPVFVTGLDPNLVQWRVDFELETDRVASVFGSEQTVTYRFRNPFHQELEGTVSFDTPIVTQPDSTEASFKMTDGQERRLSFPVVLDPDVNSGAHPIRADFDITADRSYRFSIYRTIHVGLGDIEVELASRLDDSGNLLVEQVLRNNTGRTVSFDCVLLAPNRRRQRRRVYHLGRGETRNVFVYADGAELIGSKLWLRVEEVGGARVLNDSIRAER